MPLLFAAGKLGITLIDNHVHQGIAHLLCGDLSQVLPFAPAFIVAELDFFRFYGAIESIELEAGNFSVVNADFLAPVVEHSDPLAEGSDFGYFTWHESKPLTTEDTEVH